MQAAGLAFLIKNRKSMVIEMARKEIITKQMILDNAFQMAKMDGIESVTARKLSSQLGCSTQPIFRVYSNMNELYADIYQKAIEAFGEYYENFSSDVKVPFIHLGLAYINYANIEKRLFELLFLSDKRKDRGIFELLNYSTNAVNIEINKAIESGCNNPSGLFMKMWVFIHGCAAMTITGDFDLTFEETKEFLEDIYNSVSI